MTPVWGQVKLRVSFGEIPQFSDILELATGRRYQVIGVKGRALSCIVLPPEAPVGDSRVIPWQWTSRKKRERH